MHSVLAFSATHLAWITDSSETRNVAFQYRGVALKGLHEAISSFSKETSDAILAASVLLSWHAAEWRGWASLMQGTSTVMDAMLPWKDESSLASHMDDQAMFSSVHKVSRPTLSSTAQSTRQEDLLTLQRVFQALQRIQAFTARGETESLRLSDMMNFVQSLRNALPVQTAEQQYNQLRPLREWLFWLPVTFLQNGNRDLHMLVLLAHLYAVAMAVEPLFPAVGAAYFDGMSIAPVEEIYRVLVGMQSSYSYSEELQTAIALMDFPRQTAAKLRYRIELEKERSEAYATMPHSPYGLENLNLGAGTPLADDGSAFAAGFDRSSDNLGGATSSSHPSSSVVASEQRPRYLEPPLRSNTQGYDMTPFTGYEVALNSHAYSPRYTDYEQEEEEEDEDTGYFGRGSPYTGFVPRTLWT
ncbi:MAG: hypothetical protein M1827_003381 [Pycnora praestabilis]|nr:MAG: hypothetical protein M1827_003381 [Pycnora praestabilis]